MADSTPSPSPKAVFLSYASQDAEAARRLCETLRSAGVEVWFDADGGLEHGDEWDAKIRRQVKECVLFIALISANTQAREEGYFRIEWDLAAERARGIASGVAFILPVVIDDTKEPAALVPDRFRAVQWTRLPGGNVPPDTLARFLKLWSHRAGVAKHEAQRAAESSPASPRPTHKSAWKTYVLGAGAVAALALAAAWWLKPSPPAPAPPPTVQVAPASAPQTEARRLAVRALGIMNVVAIVRADLDSAEKLCAQALELDASDAYVWRVAAGVDNSYVLFGYDTSYRRVGQARAKITRALELDPESPESRGTLASILAYSVGTPEASREAEQLATPLLKANPNDRTLLIVRGQALANLGRTDEALASYRLAKDRWAEGWCLLWAHRLDEAEKVADDGYREALATGKVAKGGGDIRQALLLKFNVELRGREDLDAAQATLDLLPESDLMEDEIACYAADVLLARREPGKVVALMQRMPKDWMTPRGNPGPYRLMFTALALGQSGHPEAALASWRAARQLVDQHLAAQPNESRLLNWKALILAHLGETAEAERALDQAESLAGQTGGDVSFETIFTYLQLGRKEAVLEALPALMKSSHFGSFWQHAYLRFDPRYDVIRDEPRFQAVLRSYLPKTAKPLPEQVPASAPADAKSVAVLAFANLSDDKDNEYFSDGISEELLTVLQKIPGLKVSARTSAFSFKGTKATATEIGQKLGVSYLVDGSVRRAGSNVRIAARLSRATTGEQVWSESYTRDLKDVFAVQSELAQTIVGQLRGQLGQPTGGTEIQAQVQAAERGGTRNPEAHQLYLQANYLLNDFSPVNVRKGISALEQAVKLDPSYALAWAGLGTAGSLLQAYGDTKSEVEEGYQLAVRSVNRALSLEPDLARAYTAQLGIQLGYEFDWKGAERSMHRALELAPSDALVLSEAGAANYALGRVDEAIRLARKAVELDPVNSQMRVNLAWFLTSQGRYQEALAEFQHVVELNPSSPWSYSGLGFTLVLLGRYDEALVAVKKERNSWAREFVLAVAQWGLGHKPEADAALTSLIADNADVAAFQIAQVYAYRHDNTQVFAWLERARRQHDGGLSWAKADAFLRPLAADPRWNSFLHEMGLADDQLK